MSDLFSDVSRLPCAHGGPVARARLRASPEDFIVREWLGFDADGDGEHWLLRVRKRGANTHWVAKQLGRIGNIHPRDIGFAGLKDRNAIAEQAFTIPVRSAVGDGWVGVRGDGFEVLSAERHRRKLKRGALRGNDFELLLREVEADVPALEERLLSVSHQGAPNYFGPQRFGHEGGNLAAAQRWFGEGTPPHDRLLRGFALSAARAQIFNAVLAERVIEGTWAQLVQGEVANLDGSNSIFTFTQIDESLRERYRTLDVHPTGPLWGTGAPAVQGAVAELEQAVATRLSALAKGLSSVDLAQERRALRLRVAQLQWSWEGVDLRLRFRLSRGGFATAVLHELLHGAFENASVDVDE